MSEPCMRCFIEDELGGNWHQIENAIQAGKKKFGDLEVINYFFDPMPGDYYGEFSPGHEGDLFIVFKFVDGRFFRKTGTGSSYGEHTWDGPVREVFPKEVQRVVYTYEEAK